MLHKRIPAALITTLSVGIFTMILIVGWIRQESKLYHTLLHYQNELQHYSDQCLRIEPHEKIEHKVCPLGFISLHGVCSQCRQGTFGLLHWTSCTKFLSCDDFVTDIRPVSLLWQTDHWQYYLANWNSFRLVYAQKYIDSFSDSADDFDKGWETATELSPYQGLLYPVGCCAGTKTMVYGVADEIYPLTQLDSVLKKRKCNNWMVRFKLAMDYVRLLDYLHLHPSGPYVLCNSHSLDILLSQFAISEHFELLLANFENLPSGHEPIVCSHRELSGNFIAPEQNWPYSHYKMFNIDEQPGYFHTSDIWKVPDVTKSLLGDSKESKKILNYLVHIHHMCKTTDYTWRPSAKDILTEYETIWNALVGDYSTSIRVHDTHPPET